MANAGNLFQVNIKLLCRNSTVLIQIPFYWRTLHLPEKKISVPILVQVVVPFPLSGAAGICQDIELQDNACSMVQRTLQKNNLEANITLIHQDLTTLKPGLTPFTQELDLIACNPPYQEAGTGLVNPDDSKRIARHEGACTPDDICRVASKLLKYGGKLCMCQRPQRLFDIMESMKKVGIMPKRLRLVQQRLSKAPSLFLLEGRKGGNSGMIVEPVLMIEDENGAFSDEMLQIYGDYKQGKRGAVWQES